MGEGEVEKDEGGGEKRGMAGEMGDGENNTG